MNAEALAIMIASDYSKGKKVSYYFSGTNAEKMHYVIFRVAELLETNVYRKDQTDKWYDYRGQKVIQMLGTSQLFRYHLSDIIEWTKDVAYESVFTDTYDKTLIVPKHQIFIITSPLEPDYLLSQCNTDAYLPDFIRNFRVFSFTKSPLIEHLNN